MTVARLRRMIAEDTQANYTDAELKLRLEENAIRDAKGNEPETPNWKPTYNIAKVASEIWSEKASILVDEFDFDADGGSYKRSQKYQHALRQAGYYASRANAVSAQMIQHPTTKQVGKDFPYKDDWYQE